LIGLGKVRLIVDPPQSGWINMATDHVLADVIPDSTKAVIRIFEWNPIAVSLGFHQNKEDVNSSTVKKRGWDLVRRPTGGRTLLHSGDVCYSIVIPRLDDHYGQLRELYSSVAAMLIKLFESFGLIATTRNETALNRDRKTEKNRLCIDTYVRGEVQIDNRKIAGASQRLFKHSILQQGSIMVDGDPGQITQILNLGESKRSELTDRLRMKACPLNRHLKKSVTNTQFINRLSQAFIEKFRIKYEDDPLSEDEMKMIQKVRTMFDLNHLLQS